MSTNEPAGKLARWAAPWGSEGESGMRLLSDGLEAFEVRAHLARHAECSIDILIYQFEDGVTSRVLTAELLAAAERGVAVRLLVDDISAILIQRMLRALVTHPRIEVRLFNPVTFWRRWFWSHQLAMGLTLARSHRRMHNKLWLVDDRLGITGGRNMSDDYFIVNSEYNFADLDMLVAGGSVVAQMRRCFDAYWQGRLVRELETLVALEADYQWPQLRDELARLLSGEELADSPWLPIHHEEARELSRGLGEMVSSEGELLWDHPDKAASRGYPPLEMSLAPALGRAIASATSHVRIVSAYFVPSERQVIDLEALLERGVTVTVLTNSLDANDAPIVNGAWAGWRQRYLELGASVHELREGHTPRKRHRRRRQHHFGALASSLHGKSITIDDDRIFVGSLNIDPRSIWWNTEMGLLVRHPELNAQLSRVIDRALEPDSSFRVTLDDHGLCWTCNDDKQRERRFRREPGDWPARVQKWVGALPGVRRLL
ncbi:phospholipase D-like domain-containing protein [Kushneria aurantia]|uniref:Phosphatidylserine/phosphatidylglycerophosphate/ cardiolipin synthase family protein n=1 Tax=Kushneria aurantia TaxID=504092 RepID=A0ABV6G5M1_9GAMM|nr:phospholipase D family protein [Kushneria aurantia]